ncbi:Hpt domain-containing protein [Qiania dongpingensis]|uniref:Hpt domain-containing protein n=1 Tax=Qiania dongpingensis TaxID=2763669 RepID=A0A7G9G6W2_9FIRM|nr:Hpt domain-containing protein [Qiania dongpingensis]QNM06544.1 Hpt domain-containing protein [Qiania dongpingensis]
MDFLEAMQKIVPDVNRTLCRFSGNQKLWERFVKKFGDDPSYSDLGKAVEENDEEGIERMAHTLKGVAANMGFDPLSEACAKLVSAVRSKKTEEYAEDWTVIQEQHGKIMDVIKDL